MSKRLAMALATGALVVAMLPSTLLAAAPTVNGFAQCTVKGGDRIDRIDFDRGTLLSVARQEIADWRGICDPMTIEIVLDRDERL